MKDPIRLAIVVSHPIQYYVPYYRALAQQGDLDVRVFFASRIGLDRTLDPGMGVEVAWKMDLLGGYRYEFLPGAENITRTGWREINNRSVGGALERFKPDVVLLHGYTQLTILKALSWCRRKGVPAIMSSDSSLHSATGAVVRAIKALILPRIFRQFSAFLSIGDANERYLTTFGVPTNRLFRVPNLVDDGFWRLREQQASARIPMRRELGLSEDDFAVLFVGKLIPRKRPGDLLAALKLLSTTEPSEKRAVVLFAGDGELRADLEHAAVRNCLPARFLGFVNVDKLPAYYCAADALAHPAEIETYGVIVLEAAIMGLPLVLSDKVGAIGPTSIARSGENAFVHASGDVEELSRILARLADEPETCSRLAAASRQISLDHNGAVSVSGTLSAVRHCLEGLSGYSAATYA